MQRFLASFQDEAGKNNRKSLWLEENVKKGWFETNNEANILWLQVSSFLWSFGLFSIATVEHGDFEDTRKCNESEIIIIGNDEILRWMTDKFWIDK